MRRRCGRLRCRRVDNALLIHRYGPPANTTLKDEPPCPATAAPKCRAPRKKGGQIYFLTCRLAVWRSPPRFPRPNRQVSPCTASHFLLSGQEKVTKEKATPTSGSGLRPDFPRCGAAPGAGLQGPSLTLYAGAPSPLAASMRLVPLRNTSTRPPDGERSPSRPRVLWIIYFFCTDRQATPTAPFRRVSGLDVEGVERHGCRESRDGPGMPPSRRAPGMAMERTNPERSAGPDGGASPFGSFWGDCQKGPAQRGGTNA
jgi:hypothetical protein